MPASTRSALAKLQLKNGGEDISGLLVLDVDDHLTRSTKYGIEVYTPHLRRLSSKWSAPWDLVLQPHIDFAHRKSVRDIGFMWESIATIRHKSGEPMPFTADELTQQVIIPYQTDLVELETQMELYRGVETTLAAIRRKWPKLFVLAHTDAPDWLALLRLQTTGILKHFDGLVAVAPEKPDLGDSPYAPCLAQSEAWLQGVEASIPHTHLQLRISLPQKSAKPSTYGLRAAMAALKVPSHRVVSSGNNRYKEGLTATRGCPLGQIRFVQVNHPGDPVSEAPADLDPTEVIRVHREIDNIPALVPYLESVFSH